MWRAATYLGSEDVHDGCWHERAARPQVAAAQLRRRRNVRAAKTQAGEVDDDLAADVSSVEHRERGAAAVRAVRAGVRLGSPRVVAVRRSPCRLHRPRVRAGVMQVQHFGVRCRAAWLVKSMLAKRSQPCSGRTDEG